MGWRRARGHVDFCDAIFDETALAHDDRPHGRGDDGFLRDDGGTLSGHPRRSRVVRLVHVSDPEFKRSLAAIPFAADVGRFRREHLSRGLDAFLVHGNDSRLCNLARPLDDADSEDYFQFSRDGLDRLGAALA